MRVDYRTTKLPPVLGAALRRGEVGCLFPGPDGNFVSETRLRLSPNSTHALMGHGVIDALNELPLEGRLASGLQVVIRPPQLEAVRRLFYLADAKTYGGTYEFVLGIDSDHEEEVEYRIRIDNREYQHTLSGLQYLLRISSREGMAVWMTI